MGSFSVTTRNTKIKMNSFERGKNPKAAMDIGARRVARKVDKIYVEVFVLDPPEERTDSRYSDHPIITNQSRITIGAGNPDFIKKLLKGDPESYLEAFGAKRAVYSMKQTLLFETSFELAEEERGPDYRGPIHFKDFLGEIILFHDEIYEVPMSRVIPNSDFQCQMKGTYELTFMEGISIPPGSGTFIIPGI